MDLRHALTDNLGVKLIALVVSVFIWFNASGQQQSARLRTVPLVFENVADTLTITGLIPSEVEIRVVGTRRQLLTLGFKRVDVVVDLSGAGPGRQRVSLSSTNVRIPSGVDRRNVTVISPTIVDLALERVVTRRVQPALTTTGTLAADLVLMENGLTIAPSWLTIRGPESTVDRIRTIPTKPLDLARVKESGDRVVQLDFDATLIACDPDRVTVSVLVGKKGQRVLANVPPTVLVDSDNIDAVVLPNAVSLTLEGPVNTLDTLSSGDVSVLLNLSGKPLAQYTMAPEVILPSGLELVGMSVDSLIVRLSDKNDVGTSE